MRKLTRADLRGKPLEPYCKSANTTNEGDCVACYGLYQNNISGTNEEIADCCRKCKAFVENVEDKSE